MAITRLLFLSFLFPLFAYSQTLTGRVIDKVTQEPIETVSVYFDNTTVGTTTNENGEFSIAYTDAIQSVLVISYLGYEKVLISDYRNKDKFNIELVEAKNELDEVILNYDDGLTRKQKLRLFKKEFLGTSTFGRSCKILNEDDLILYYDKKEMALYANSKQSIRIENKGLQYLIEYDLKDFEIRFKYVDAKVDEFTIQMVQYYGTSFYKNLKKAERKRTLKNREKVFKGSVQHFMRALFNEKLVDEGYWIFYDKFRVDEWDYFTVETIEASNFKKVALKDSVTILYDKDVQSKIQMNIDEFFVDAYGNHMPVIGVYFAGAMGSQRVGDTLPMDYGLK